MVCVCEGVSGVERGQGGEECGEECCGGCVHAARTWDCPHAIEGRRLARERGASAGGR